MEGSGPLSVVYIGFHEDGVDCDHLIVAITGNGPTSIANARGIVALRNAAPAYLAALARIAEIVAVTCATKQWDEGICEIQDVLAGAVEGGG
jgi:hypothetical protein